MFLLADYISYPILPPKASSTQRLEGIESILAVIFCLVQSNRLVRIIKRPKCELFVYNKN